MACWVGGDAPAGAVLRPPHKRKRRARLTALHERYFIPRAKKAGILTEDGRRRLSRRVMKAVLDTNVLVQVFSDPQFTIPGATPLEQYQNLVNAILRLNRGRLQGLYMNLGGK